MDGEPRDDMRAQRVLDASVVRAFHDQLAGDIDTTDPIATIRACEEAKNALAAV